MPALCPLCALDEYTSVQTDPDGKKYVVCRNSRQHGLDGYVWEQPAEARDGRAGTRADGLGIELGIWEKLLECVPSDGKSHSYGDVEDAFIARFPAEAATLQSRYGHRWRDGRKSDGTYSMSVYLALRLIELRREGLLEAQWLPAEGEWAYNGVISHWRTR